MSDTGLYLVTPPLERAEPFAASLEAALEAAEVASLLLRLAPTEGDAAFVRLVKEIAAPAQAKGVAVLVENDPALVLEAGADGAHVTGAGEALQAAVRRLAPGHIVGAGGLASRHDAMLAGEAGADYLLFGDWAAPLSFEEALERVRWWAELFTTPCVAFARSLEDARLLAAAGADFVMLGDCVWSDPRGPAAAIADARRAFAD
jgi:thiamine-phosphate pyrophosphorylase